MHERPLNQFCLVLFLYRFITFCSLTAEIFSINAAATTNEIAPYECQIEAKSNENFDYAAVQLWAPARSREVRGILCMVLHPLDRGGSKLAHPKPWIELANSRDCALVTISFAQSDDSSRDWCSADQGTGRALFAALDFLAKKSGISNLSRVPIVINGVCAAGQFAYHLAAFDPIRITAFVTIGGGMHDLSKIKSATGIPALLVVTPDRGPLAVQNLEALYQRGRSYAAPWLRTSENISKYDAGQCSLAVFSYLRETLDSFRNRHRIVTIDGLLAGGLSTYLPISMCGEKLSILGINEPAEIALGTIDSFGRGASSCSFNVVAKPDLSADGIFIPIRDSGITTDIQKINARHWHVTCLLDSKRLFLGPLHLELPVRYLRKGQEVLGGTATILSGFVTGEVACVPRYVNFGGLESGKLINFKLCLSSKNPEPIRIGAVTSTFPWIKTICNPNEDGTSEIVCSVDPPAGSYSDGFSGYLQIQIEAPVQKRLLVFYYGAVNQSAGREEGAALPSGIGMPSGTFSR